MTAQEVKDYLLEHGCEGAAVWDDFAGAFIGSTSDGRAVYSFDKMVEILMSEGETEEDAKDYIDYNCIGWRVTDMDPVILFPVRE